jgi:hypothetical protein
VNVVKWFQYYIQKLAATDPVALGIAGISNAAPYTSFTFDPSVSVLRRVLRRGTARAGAEAWCPRARA